MFKINKMQSYNFFNKKQVSQKLVNNFFEVLLK
jgi:hypothetical protein